MMTNRLGSLALHVALLTTASLVTGCTSLVNATMAHDAGKVKAMLAEGKNPNETDENISPVCQATLQGDSDIAIMLVDGGADLSSSCTTYGGQSYTSPLHLAFERCRVEIVEHMLQNPSHLLAKDIGYAFGIFNWDSPCAKTEKLVDLVLADIGKTHGESARDNFAKSMLARAAIENKAEFMRAFLSAGGDPNGMSKPTNIDDVWPLYFFAEAGRAKHGSSRALDILRKAGADMTAKSGAGVDLKTSLQTWREATKEAERVAEVARIADEEEWARIRANEAAADEEYKRKYQADEEAWRRRAAGSTIKNPLDEARTSPPARPSTHVADTSVRSSSQVAEAPAMPSQGDRSGRAQEEKSGKPTGEGSDRSGSLQLEAHAPTPAPAPAPEKIPPPREATNRSSPPTYTPPVTTSRAECRDVPNEGPIGGFEFTLRDEAEKFVERDARSKCRSPYSLRDKKCEEVRYFVVDVIKGKLVRKERLKHRCTAYAVCEKPRTICKVNGSGGSVKQ